MLTHLWHSLRSRSTLLWKTFGQLTNNLVARSLFVLPENSQARFHSRPLFFDRPVPVLERYLHQGEHVPWPDQPIRQFGKDLWCIATSPCFQYQRTFCITTNEKLIFFHEVLLPILQQKKIERARDGFQLLNFLQWEIRENITVNFQHTDRWANLFRQLKSEGDFGDRSVLPGSFTSMISSILVRSAERQRLLFFSVMIDRSRSRIGTFERATGLFNPGSSVWFSRMNCFTLLETSWVIRPCWMSNSNTWVIVNTLARTSPSSLEWMTMSNYRWSRMWFCWRLFSPFCSRSKNTTASVTCRPSARRLCQRTRSLDWKRFADNYLGGFEHARSTGHNIFNDQTSIIRGESALD